MGDDVMVYECLIGFLILLMVSVNVINWFGLKLNGMVCLFGLVRCNVLILWVLLKIVVIIILLLNVFLCGEVVDDNVGLLICVGVEVCCWVGGIDLVIEEIFVVGVDVFVVLVDLSFLSSVVVLCILNLYIYIIMIVNMSKISIIVVCNGVILNRVEVFFLGVLGSKFICDLN